MGPQKLRKRGYARASKKMLNKQIFRDKEVLIEVACELSKEKVHKMIKLEDKRENTFYQKIFKVRT